MKFLIEKFLGMSDEDFALNENINKVKLLND